MADTREKGTLVVDVTGDCDDNLALCNITMELDDEANSGNTCFAPGTNAYFRVYSNVGYSCKATLGTPRIDNRGVGEVITEEYVDFTNWSGSTIYPVHALKSYEWQGRSLGAINYIRDTGSLSADKTKQEGFGVAKISYSTQYDRWVLSSPEEGDVIAYSVGTGVCSDTKASVTIQFRNDCAGVQNNYVTLTFKNNCRSQCYSGWCV